LSTRKFPVLSLLWSNFERSSKPLSHFITTRRRGNLLSFPFFLSLSLSFAFSSIAFEGIPGI
jgi:hypothetical protein